VLIGNEKYYYTLTHTCLLSVYKVTKLFNHFIDCDQTMHMSG